MNKIISFLTILAVISCVSALDYVFQVSLSPVKNEHGNLNGTLKAYVQTSEHKNFFELNKTTLIQGKNYTSNVNYPYHAYDIITAAFQWTLTPPYPPKFLTDKPSIYLRKLSLIPIYMQNPEFIALHSKHFCPHFPNVGIKHNETLALTRC